MNRIVTGILVLFAVAGHAAQFNVGARVVSSAHVAMPQAGDAAHVRVSTHGAAAPLALVGADVQRLAVNGDLALPVAGTGDVMVTLLY